MNVNWHHALWLGLATLIAGTMAGLWTGTRPEAPMGVANVETQRHYHAYLAQPTVNIVEVIQTAQELNYWIRIQTGADVTYLQGEMPCPTCDPAQEAQFFRPPRLYVDGSDFWIHLDEVDWTLHLRPAAHSASSYELVVSPKLPKTQVTAEDLANIRATLAPFGVLPDQGAPLEFEPLIPPTKPEPPEGTRMDSVLYGLTLAPDWVDYARRSEIGLSGLRAKVIIELASAGADPPGDLDLVIESRSDELVRAQVLIHQLVELARRPSVAFVRPPSRPQPAGV